MPLENFYQADDTSAERRQNRVALAVIAVAAYLLCGWTLLSNYRAQEAARAAEAEQIKSLYAMCDGLPKPSGFVFVRRDEPVRHETGSSVYYFYRSDRTLEETMPDFERRLALKSWKRIAGTNTFTNASQTILIDRADAGDAVYSLYCYQPELSFGIYD